MDDEAQGMTAQDRLAAAIGEARAAGNKADRAAAVASVLRDGELMQDLGFALLEDPDGMAGLLVEFGGLPGLDSPVRQIRKRIEEIAADRRAELYPPLRLADDEEEREPVRLGDAPPLDIPARYIVKASGIWEKKQKPEGIELVRLTHRPILPTLALTDVDTGEMSVRLTWAPKGGMEWGGRIVPAATVQDPRSFVALRNAGAPVAAHNASALARFIDQVEEVNAEAIPQAWATKRMGWLHGGDLGFALGENVIGGDGSAMVQLDHDGGEAQIASALQPAGDLQAWLGMVRRVTGLPSPMIAIYAAIAAPLLEIIQTAPNAIIDWSGETSHGKTTILRLAASVWGNPDERGGGYVQKWNQTATHLERVAAFCNGIPMCCDDTKDVPERQRDMLPRSGYQIAGGRGRGRGTIRGTQRAATWRTVMLSTGEAPFTSFAQDGGLRARVLCIQGQPLGDGRQEALANDISETACANYGHFGPVVVHWLMEHRKAWPKIAEGYQTILAEYEAQATRPATKRLARIVALLEAARRIGEACGLPPATCDPIGHAWAAAEQGGEDTDRPRAAAREVYSWAVSHASEFWGRHITDRDGTARQPSKGWAGKWDRQTDWTEIVFKPECLESLLRHLHYEPAAIIPLWIERGWTTPNEAGRDTFRTSVDGERVRWFAITRAALDD